MNEKPDQPSRQTAQFESGELGHGLRSAERGQASFVVVPEPPALSSSKPFPHTTAWNLPDSFWDGEPDWPPDAPIEEQDRLMEAWDRELVTHYWNAAVMNGAT